LCLIAIQQPDEITECREEFNDDVGREDEVVEDEDYDDEAEYNGVNAVELERRLHELLHQRNQERIEELELALKRAEKKLVEKEMEVSMWKDTAKLALRQDSSTMLW
jgi:polyribonucleotide nucleotidyltransferase